MKNLVRRFSVKQIILSDVFLSTPLALALIIAAEPIAQWAGGPGATFYLVVGVVIVEVVFVYPGLGQILVDAVSNRDVTVVQAACLIFAATYILLNLTADILSIIANPRLLHPR